jgi:hypothetical protein
MNRVCRTVAAAVLILGATFVAQVSAQSSGGQYRIDAVVIASGGGPIGGGNYQITSTLGQPATEPLAGGSYALFNGFWSPVGGVAGDFVFANGFE